MSAAHQRNRQKCRDPNRATLVRVEDRHRSSVPLGRILKRCMDSMGPTAVEFVSSGLNMVFDSSCYVLLVSPRRPDHGQLDCPNEMSFNEVPCIGTIIAWRLHMHAQVPGTSREGRSRFRVEARRRVPDLQIKSPTNNDCH